MLVSVNNLKFCFKVAPPAVWDYRAGGWFQPYSTAFTSFSLWLRKLPWLAAWVRELRTAFPLSLKNETVKRQAWPGAPYSTCFLGAHMAHPGVLIQGIYLLGGCYFVTHREAWWDRMLSADEGGRQETDVKRGLNQIACAPSWQPV